MSLIIIIIIITFQIIILVVTDFSFTEPNLKQTANGRSIKHRGRSHTHSASLTQIFSLTTDGGRSILACLGKSEGRKKTHTHTHTRATENRGLMKPMIFKLYSSAYFCLNQTELGVTDGGLNGNSAARGETSIDKRQARGACAEVGLNHTSMQATKPVSATVHVQLIPQTKKKKKKQH